MQVFNALVKFTIAVVLGIAALCIWFHYDGPVEFSINRSVNAPPYTTVVDITARVDGFDVEAVSADFYCVVNTPALAQGKIVLNKGESIRAYITSQPGPVCTLDTVYVRSYGMDYPMYNWAGLIPGILSYF